MQLFVYGSLMNDEVVHKLLSGKSFKKVQARLKDYAVFALSDRKSPGMIPKKGGVVHGIILVDVDEESFKIIQRWENDDYFSTEVTVETNNKQTLCTTFIWKGDVLDLPWDNISFRKDALPWYLDVDIPQFLHTL